MATRLLIIAEIKRKGLDAPVVMFTNTGTEEVAAAGLRAGLADYIIKTPAHYGRLAHAVRNAIANATAVRGARAAQVREHEALRTAEAALRAKNEFLATLSHELRTPLNAISGWLQIIKTQPIPDSMTRGLAAMERNAVLLTRLIADLVDTPPMGRISVTAGEVDLMIGVWVADNGPGIRAEFLPRLFDRFSQQDSGMSREHGGLGLGLAIVRHLSEMHGGSVSASSTEGEGATFCLRVPIADAGMAAAAPTVHFQQHAVLAGVHVLVVDDEADAREFVTTMLQNQGAVVTAAESAAEGFNVLVRAVADVLVCDVGMPTEDGLTFIGRIRQSDKASVAAVPALAVTAYAREQDRQQVLRAGFQGYLAKPLSAHELVSIVRHLARGSVRRSTRDAANTAPVVQT